MIRDCITIFDKIDKKNSDCNIDLINLRELEVAELKEEDMPMV